MNSKPANPQLTEADLDAALGTEAAGILPSSGFADNVMTAIYREVNAPAPIPFPWKRAVPGLIAGLAAIALLCALMPSILHTISISARRAPAVSIHWQAFLAPPSHHTANVTWLGTSVAISLACLAFCRRLVSSR